jgi:hypothetical protein
LRINIKKNSILKRIIFTSIIAVSLLLSACSTDFDVTGDYKETLVIYGLLDQAADTQYVKINKAFLGQGNAFEYAQIKDSTQFRNALNVKIKSLTSGIEYNLTPANYIPKDDGLFYGPDQTNVIYKLYSDGAFHDGVLYPKLNINSTYELTVTNSETGTVASAKTVIVGDVGAFSKPLATGTTFSFVIPGPYPNYPFPVEWTSAKNARVYQTILRLHYKDSTTSGTVNKVLDYTFPEIHATALTGGEVMENIITGSAYYKFIGNNLSDYSGLIARIPGNVDILLISGADELSTFIDVNKPSTGIIQEKPEYTNITNGLGLFSSRYNKVPNSKPLSSTSLDSLSGGQYTCTLKFLDKPNSTGVWTMCH